MFNTPQTQGLDDRLAPSIHEVPQIDSSLTSPSPSSKLGTEPQSHHQLHISQYITNAGRQGFQQGNACRTSTKDVVG